jgi:PPOX class probable F420-dependent enzyme
VVWIKREDDTVLFSATARRQKVRNLRRDPRVSRSVFDLAAPCTSVEIRGTAEILPDEDKRLPYELSHKYLGIDPPGEKDDEVRLIIRVVPRKIVGFAVGGRGPSLRPGRRSRARDGSPLRVRAPGGAARM